MKPFQAKAVRRLGLLFVVFALPLVQPTTAMAQVDSPSAQEVREALETLRRFERALAAQPLESETAELAPPPSEVGALRDPLIASTVGSDVGPQVVEVPDSYALSLNGDLALEGALFKDGAPFLHNDGGAQAHNTALGWAALVNLTPGTPEGYSGMDNTGVGHGALFATSSGHNNTAIGYRALRNNSTGSFNTAVGRKAAFQNTTGSSNTAIGLNAGYGWMTGSNNIAIGFGALGSAGESGVTRIGGNSAQTKAFIEGIYGATVSGGSQVYINGFNQLGTATSSARFKQDIGDLEGATDRLHDLRPVSFRYRGELAGSRVAGEQPLEYGLIAEEVAEIFPELVANDEEGRPFTVRYHLLTPLLLAEIQRLEERLASQHEEHQLMVADLRRRLDELANDVRRPTGDQE